MDREYVKTYTGSGRDKSDLGRGQGKKEDPQLKPSLITAQTHTHTLFLINFLWYINDRTSF